MQEIQSGTESVLRGGNDVVLTGATGFLGKVVLHELIRQRETLGISRVRVLVRTGRNATASGRFKADIASSPCFAALDPGWAEYVEPVACNLGLPGAGIDDAEREYLQDSATHVINCAASVQFDLPVIQAAEANVTTALEMQEFARGCRSLRSFVSVSTAYVTPHGGDLKPVPEELAALPGDAMELYEAIRRGGVDEKSLLAKSGHPNTYTLTKSIAEHLLCERMGSLPLVLVRPSIISSSLHQPFPGWIDSPAAFALFACQIGAGRMRAVIARPESRLDVVPCDAVAERVIGAAFTPVRMNGSRTPAILHAVAGHDHSPNIRSCVSTIETFFCRNPDTRRSNRDLSASVRYLGPDGPLYRLNHWLYHERGPALRRKAESLAAANRMFAYFTHKTFCFQSSVPFDPPGFNATDYIETVCRGVSRHLMGADHTAVPIAGRLHPRSGKDLRWAWSQPRGNLFIRGTAALVASTLRKCTDSVTFDLESFEAALKAVPEGAHPVLVPSHRSYLDFVLCSLLMFARPDLGIPIPHIAATSDFARIPVISWLILRLHAFYIERGLGRADNRLTGKVRDLVKSGRVIEFFIEGKRSRSRQFLPPRRGLLRSLQATGETFAVLPIAFSYERLPEEAAFTAELSGQRKPPMRLRDLVRWYGRVRKGEVQLGRAHIVCGQPVMFGPESDIHGVADAIMEELQYETVTTKYHLNALLEQEKEALADIDLAWLAQAVEQRGGSVLNTYLKDPDVPPVHERCMRYHYEHLFYGEAAQAFAGNPAIENHVRRNGYRAAAPPDFMQVPDEQRMHGFLRALFGQLVRNYRLAIDSLGGPDGELRLDTPQAVVRARQGDGLHLPDVEGLFDDLLERSILAFDDEKKVYSWGPEAARLRTYRECLDRF